MLYSQVDLNTRLTAVLLNGIHTEQKYEFFMSLQLMRKLIIEDNENGNIKRKSLNDVEYRKFVATLVKNKIIAIVDYSEVKSINFPSGKAGTWKLINKDCLKLVLQDKKLDSAELYNVEDKNDFQNDEYKIF